jgi:hypothetical protein
MLSLQAAEAEAVLVAAVVLIDKAVLVAAQEQLYKAGFLQHLPL